MTKPKLAVVLATHNEEINLARCLEAIRDIADEIIIADESSTDHTVDIAKKFGAKVIPTEHRSNFHITKNIAIDAATGDWILQLDADEIVSPELANEIKEVIKVNKYNGYWVNRKNWFLTRFLTKGGQYPDPTLRLYRKGKGRLPAKDVHEQAVVDGSVGHLKHDLLHYRDTSFKKYLTGFERYSSLVAMQLREKKKPISFFQSLNYLFLKPLVILVKIYVRHRGYVDGLPGFIFALFSGLIYPVAYVKYLQHSK